MRCTERVTRMGEMRNEYKILVLTLEWKRPIKRRSFDSVDRTKIQASVIIRCSAISVYIHQRFYFSIMKSINILSAATVETAARAQWTARSVSPTWLTLLTQGTTNSSLMVHHSEINGYVLCFPYYALWTMWPIAGKQSPRIMRFTCVKT
jgi:hypothetical protein